MKYKDRAPKYMGTLQMMVIVEGSESEQFYWGDNPVLRWHVVP